MSLIERFVNTWGLAELVRGLGVTADGGLEAHIEAGEKPEA